MAAFEILKAGVGQFHFHLKAGNGQIIFNSQQYKSKASVQVGIDSVKTNAADDARFERKESVGHQPYFVLHAANGETLGRSQMYSSTAAMEKGIASVRKNAPAAAVQDMA